MSIFSNADKAIQQEAEKQRAVEAKNEELSNLVETLLDNELTKVTKAKDFRAQVEKTYKVIAKETTTPQGISVAEASKHRLRILSGDLPPSKNVAAIAIYDMTADELAELKEKFGHRIQIADYASNVANRDKVQDAIQLIISCNTQKSIGRVMPTLPPYDKYYNDAIVNVERKRKGLI